MVCVKDSKCPKKSSTLSPDLTEEYNAHIPKCVDKTVMREEAKMDKRL